MLQSWRNDSIFGTSSATLLGSQCCTSKQYPLYYRWVFKLQLDLWKSLILLNLNEKFVFLILNCKMYSGSNLNVPFPGNQNWTILKHQFLAKSEFWPLNFSKMKLSLFEIVCKKYKSRRFWWPKIYQKGNFWTSTFTKMLGILKEQFIFGKL